MNLTEIIHKVWEDRRVRELRTRKDEVETVLKVFVDVVRTEIVKGTKIKLHRLFSLSIKKNKKRRIMNPQTKKHMYTKDYYKVHIEPSKNLKDALKDKVK